MIHSPCWVIRKPRVKHTTEISCMPRHSSHILLGSEKDQHYELRGQVQLQQCFRSDDTQLWQDWLSAHTSFAFRGQRGSLSVVKEARPRGGGYWYVYRAHHQQTRKRYIGPTPRVTLERLEQEALALASPKMKRDAHKHPALLPASSQAHETFIETKYAPPRPGATLVQRERLIH